MGLMQAMELEQLGPRDKTVDEPTPAVYPIIITREEKSRCRGF